jgi:hypothetical protein
LLAFTGTAIISNYTGAEASVLSYEPAHLVYPGLSAGNAGHVMAYN